MKYKILDCMSLVGTMPSFFNSEKIYVSTGAVDCDHIDYEKTEMVTYRERPSRANLMAKEGDVLFAKMHDTKKTLYIDAETAEYIFSTGFYAVRAKEKVIMAKLLYHVMSSDQFLKQKDRYCSGATQKAITNTGLKKIVVSVPPLDEQPKIILALDKISDLITKRRQQLDKLDELVKSRFIEIFGDPVYNNNHLPTKSLGELGTLDRGRSQHRPRNAPELLNGPYPLIQTGNVSSAGLFITEYQQTYSELGLRQSKMWKAGTLCITIAANIAQTSILTFDACFPDSIVGFIPNNDVSAIYVYYWFGFFQKILEEQAPQVAQKNINLKILSALEVMVPSYEQQKQFIAFVTQTDKSKSWQKKGIEYFQRLEKRMRQEWL